jgi:hypothetical protein
MTTVIKQVRLGARLTRAAAFCLVALASVLCQSREARAQWTTSGTTTSTTNNVGIGTTAPAAPLEVRVGAGDVFTRFTNAGGQNGALDLRYKFESSQHRMGLTDGNGQWMFYTRFAPANTDSVGFFPGRVGIGTETPQSLFDVSGSTGMTLRNGGASSGFSFFDRSTVPGDQVVIQGNAGNYSMVNVATRGANVGTEKGAGFSFWTVDIANTTNATMFQMQYTPNYGPVFFTYKFGTGAQGDKKISFQSAWQNPSSAPTQLVLDTNGSIGIGTATPGAKLDVVGDIRASGNISAKYQDVAEWVPTTQKLAAGTVVVLDTGRDNHVLASNRAYDTHVAGVISAQPGLSLGEAGEGKVLVATTGRVKVKVDATRAPIQIGDLIVTSDVAGMAMRSEPVSVGGFAMHRPGTLIGKALESLEKGTGEILVLLSLQ